MRLGLFASLVLLCGCSTGSGKTGEARFERVVVGHIASARDVSVFIGDVEVIAHIIELQSSDSMAQRVSVVSLKGGCPTIDSKDEYFVSLKRESIHYGLRGNEDAAGLSKLVVHGCSPVSLIHAINEALANRTAISKKCGIKEPDRSANFLEDFATLSAPLLSKHLEQQAAQIIASAQAEEAEYICTPEMFEQSEAAADKAQADWAEIKSGK